MFEWYSYFYIFTILLPSSIYCYRLMRIAYYMLQIENVFLILVFVTLCNWTMLHNNVVSIKIARIDFKFNERWYFDVQKCRSFYFCTMIIFHIFVFLHNINYFRIFVLCDTLFHMLFRLHLWVKVWYEIKLFEKDFSWIFTIVFFSDFFFFSLY